MLNLNSISPNISIDAAMASNTITMIPNIASLFILSLLKTSLQYLIVGREILSELSFDLSTFSNISFVNSCFLFIFLHFPTKLFTSIRQFYPWIDNHIHYVDKKYHKYQYCRVKYSSTHY